MLNLYKKSIAEKLEIDKSNVTLFWKGRVAFYAILKALGIKEGDEVIIPAFTCVVVPNAIIYLGARPVYSDIEPKTFNIDVNKIENKITSKTKVIIAQNTFGLSADLDPILDIAQRRQLTVVEDCAHGFGGKYKNKMNGTIADVSFFSTQWNKPYSTGIGGFAVTKRRDLKALLNTLESQTVTPNMSEKIILKLLLIARDNILNSSTHWKLVTLYRFLSKYNLIVGSSQGDELVKPELPGKFFKGFTKTQARKGVQELGNMGQNIRHQIKAAKYYKNVLAELGIGPPFEPTNVQHTFLKFPLLVKERNTFMMEAEKAGIEIGDWFLSPIHPVTKQFDNWNYKYGANPVAEEISRHIVNLPTHQGIKDEEVEKIELFINNQKKNLLEYPTFKNLSIYK